MKMPSSHAEEHLYVIPQIQLYKGNHEPLLSEEKTIAIKDKLTLEKTTLQKTKER